jgi:hypothetical protein
MHSMSGEAAVERRETRAGGRALRATDFSFLPQELLEKCRPFIVRYHEMNGYASLPDILWNPEIRNLINSDAHLNRLFKASTSSRSAKRANEGLIGIATLILALEILATGTAGWGDRYPAERDAAQVIRDEFLPNARPWLLECYLYPDAKRRRDALSAAERMDTADSDALAQFERSARS